MNFQARLWIKRLNLHKHPVIFYVTTNKPIIALTIDDGPCPTTTVGILDVLREYNAYATFFLITNRIKKQEVTVQRIIKERHELGNHLTRDFPSVLLTGKAFEYELRAADEVLRRFTTPHFFRPANAFYNSTLLKILEHYNYECVLGDILPIDIIVSSPSIVARYIFSHILPGSIITLHDRPNNGHQTIETLRILLPELQNQGISIVTVGQLISQAALLDYHN